MSIIKYIAERWSPRSFSPKAISAGDMDTLFEAAGRAPSSMNEQPWRYYYSFKGEAGFDKMAGCLLPGNRVWAEQARVLILSVAARSFSRNGKTNRHAVHDVGAANAFLSLQAASMGFQVHQMGGYDIEQTYRTLEIDSESFEAVTFMAVGYPGDPSELDPGLRKLETGPGIRNKITSFCKHFA